jgi:hypothetical protein
MADLLGWPTPGRQDLAFPPHVEPLARGWRAGHFTLPEETVAGLEARTKIEAAIAKLPVVPTAAAVASELVEGIQEAALAGAELPGPEQLFEAERKATVVDAYRQMLLEALARLRVPVDAERMITDHLRVALDSVLDEAKKPARTIGPAVIPPEALEHLDAKKRAARRQLLKLAERYGAIREAWISLRKPELDTGTASQPAGIFGELKEGGYVWDSRAMMGRVQSPPWPQDAAARLAWFVLNDVTPWLPLGGEQDRAYKAWHEEAEEDRRQRTAEHRRRQIAASA